MSKFTIVNVNKQNKFKLVKLNGFWNVNGRENNKLLKGTEI
jgi:hypothetical protein